jgi:hypothetical protein
MEVRLQWAGDLAEYIPLSPRVDLPEGVERIAVTASSSTADGRNVVSYQLALRAAAVGEYMLSPVELRYTPRAAPSPLTSQVEGPTVVVGRPTILGLIPERLVLTATGTITAISLFVLLFRRRRRTHLAPARDSGARHQNLRQQFDAARMKRLQGDAAGFVEDVSNLLTELGGEPDAEFAGLLEQVRYGGRDLPAESLDSMQRNVERRIESLRHDPEKNEREAVRLAEEEE